MLNRARSRRPPDQDDRIISAEREGGGYRVFAANFSAMARGRQGQIVRLVLKSGAGGKPSFAKTENGKNCFKSAGGAEGVAGETFSGKERKLRAKNARDHFAFGAIVVGGGRAVGVDE